MAEAVVMNKPKPNPKSRVTKIPKPSRPGPKTKPEPLKKPKVPSSKKPNSKKPMPLKKPNGPDLSGFLGGLMNKPKRRDEGPKKSVAKPTAAQSAAAAKKRAADNTIIAKNKAPSLAAKPKSAAERARLRAERMGVEGPKKRTPVKKTAKKK